MSLERKMNISEAARTIFDIEINAIEKTKNAINEDFEKIVDLTLHW